MLLASNDLLAVKPVTKRLMAFGIPIALCKGSGASSGMEVWVQRDSDFSLARRLLAAREVLPPVGHAPGQGFCLAGRQQAASGVLSRLGSRLGWSSRRQ